MTESNFFPGKLSKNNFTDSKLAAKLGLSAQQYSAILDEKESGKPLLELTFRKLQTSAFKANKTRVFRLYPQCVNYSKPGVTEPIGEFPLAAISGVSDVRPSDSHKHRWLFSMRLADHKFLLETEDQDAAERWVVAVRHQQTETQQTEGWYTNSKGKIVQSGDGNKFWKADGASEGSESQFMEECSVVASAGDLFRKSIGTAFGQGFLKENTEPLSLKEKNEFENPDFVKVHQMYSYHYYTKKTN